LPGRIGFGALQHSEETAGFVDRSPLPTRYHVKQQEDQESAQQAAEQLNVGPLSQGEEKEFSFRAENGERAESDRWTN